ncbi:MAG: HlyC/CorC family transporter [Xanthomonadales bacterium]|nr:HlyC/CorC family transporter [Xanthomonadales bacterium]NNL95878.1 HlyC/CorC family transporter [Xanthomonadales bacterium]
MLLLITYVLIALVFSFLCSIAEAVLLSISSSYVMLLEREGKRSGVILAELKEDIGKPLAAILTLNTIAHTVGAVGAGAQAAVVFGSAYLGIASAILTLLILVFSEIIPKTLGALHWRRLAPMTAYGLRVLIWLLYPFIWLSEKITGGMSEGVVMSGYSRQEIAAMAELSADEGQIARRESEIVKNLLRLRRIRVIDILTPRTVLFTLPEQLTVRSFFEDHGNVRFSRIPVYGDEQDHVNGFVLRADIVTAYAHGEHDKALADYRRDLPALLETISLNRAFNLLMNLEAHIAMVVDEYGDLQGIVTLEDILETLLGLEIVDEGDDTVDMRELARRRWERRSRELGLDLPGPDDD